MRLKGNMSGNAEEMVYEWKNPGNQFGKRFAEYEIYQESDMDKASKLAVDLAKKIEENENNEPSK